jgi:hypothetical protein
MNCVCCGAPLKVDLMPSTHPKMPAITLLTCWNPTCPHLYRVTLDSRDYADTDFTLYGCCAPSLECLQELAS